MTFPLLAAAAFTLATLLVATLAMVLLRLWRPVSRRAWKRLGWLHLALFALHLFVTFPAALGLLGSRGLGTRPQERAYAGPRLGADGRLLVQTWASLRAEQEGTAPAVAADVLAAAAARAHSIPSSGVVVLRAFRVEPRQEPPVAAVVLVHGLFRSAMELEPVAAMLHELGCECWLLELRNHGGSSRAPFTGGLRESDDVVAAYHYVRAQAGRERTPVALFAVSLGTIAASLATVRCEGLAGLALDAPMEDLGAAALRMLAFARAGDRRSWFRVDPPWSGLVLRALEAWSGFRIADASPQAVLATLPHDLPVLVVGGAEDDRAPPARVEELFLRLPMPAARKQLWIRQGSGHGDVWIDDPAGYAERLARWLAQLRR